MIGMPISGELMVGSQKRQLVALVISELSARSAEGGCQTTVTTLEVTSTW